MTRETKVGLLIGTLILLLVGIVVSDHLAVKQEQDRMASEAFPGIQPRSVPVDASGNANPGAVVPGTLANGTGHAGPSQVIPTYRELGIDHNLQAIVPGYGQRSDSNSGGAAADANQSGQPGSNPLAINDANRNSDDRINNLRELLRNNNLLENGNRTTGENEVDSAITPGNPTASRVRPVIHYVKPGETLWAIADQYYGDGTKWAIIKSHNKDKVPADNQVREGVRLEIPNRVVEGAIAANGTDGGTTSPADNRAGNNTAGRTVTIKSGDNLTRIAQVHLGSARHVDLIVKANKDKIRNANQIRIGMVLRLPAVPGASSAGNGDAPSSTTGTTPNRNTTATPTRDTTPPASTPRRYVVQEGDTLSAVAAETLGNRNRWKEIWTLNKTRIPNPNVLSEGLALTLPARER